MPNMDAFNAYRDFYPRPPRGGRRFAHGSCLTAHFYFYPRPPRGGRLGFFILCRKMSNFYPRPPRGGRQLVRCCSCPRSANFYPRPPRGGRQLLSTTQSRNMEFLSTPSARRATWHIWRAFDLAHISIHALREEGDIFCFHHFFIVSRFLSTPSARRATRMPVLTIGRLAISIHALREEGDHGRASRVNKRYISIHALREEGDRRQKGVKPESRIFLSTPSARRATKACPKAHWTARFLSTPSARRATRTADQCGHAYRHFYPRPPRGGRLYPV